MLIILICTYFSLEYFHNAYWQEGEFVFTGKFSMTLILSEFLCSVTYHVASVKMISRVK